MIVDASRLGRFLSEPAHEDSVPIRKWLDEQGGRIVYSTAGKFADEVVGKVRTKLEAYYRAGKAVYVPRERFEQDAETLAPQIRSNDPHVIALARAAGVRLLYTGDGALRDDFKDKRFIDQPRGKVYSRAGNANLLTRSVCARR
ncbi:MAG: hypothetical protein OXP28_16320 [Gammaproteobacteria bacterium]|nr:hypothetical protein [Gammaproteobacteria bacterium]